MRSLFLAIAIALMVSGCGLKEIFTIKSDPIERPTLEIPDPDPVNQLAIEWYIITRGNLEAKLKEIEAENGVLVLFALTPEGYQHLAMNAAEMRRFIQQQKAIIGVLKNYYEKKPEKKEEKK